MINDFRLSENFNLNEFECRHCGAVKIDPILIDKLQQLRERVGAPLIVNSGYRCKTHNNTVGGSENSYHLYGQAADISVHNLKLSAESLANLAEAEGFNGIGVYGNFVHVDIRPEPKKARWEG